MHIEKTEKKKCKIAFTIWIQNSICKNGFSFFFPGKCSFCHFLLGRFFWWPNKKKLSLDYVNSPNEVFLCQFHVEKRNKFDTVQVQTTPNRSKFFWTRRRITDNDDMRSDLDCRWLWDKFHCHYRDNNSKIALETLMCLLHTYTQLYQNIEAISIARKIISLLRFFSCHLFVKICLPAINTEQQKTKSDQTNAHWAQELNHNIKLTTSSSFSNEMKR